MVYAKASSHNFGLIEELPELSDLGNITDNNEDKKYDNYLRDKYTPPNVSGMNGNQNLNMSTLSNSANHHVYNSPEEYTYKSNPEIMDNESRLNIENLTDDIVAYQPSDNRVPETKNYSEPHVRNYTPWPAPYNYSQPNYGYYNNPYNYPSSFPATSNYQQYTQYPPFPPQNHANIVNGYSIPVERFDNAPNLNAPNLNLSSVPIPSSLQNRKGELNRRKLKRDIKKYRKHHPPSGNPWQNYNNWNEALEPCPPCNCPPCNNNNQVIYIIVIVVLLIVCLILLQKVLIV